jgi:glycosyltransferase involved in cell wall biosynthesis
MRTLILNSMDLQGGAAIATYRLFQALGRAGADVSMVVQQKSGDDPNVWGPATQVDRALAWVRPRLDQMPLRLYPARKPVLFSPAVVPGVRGHLLGASSPDLVHASWITGGFLRPEALASLGKPVVWTLHDMWPFTGGCHYAGECRAYEAACGACPELGSSKSRDLSRRVWRRKERAWQDMALTVVTPSRWLAQCARASSLFRDKRVEVIPNCIDTDVYKPADRRLSREILGLPSDRALVLLLAERALSDLRKGHQHLVAAMRLVGGQRPDLPVEVVIVGESRPRDPIDLGVPVHYLGKLSDDAAKVLAYSAADIVVTPSTQENLSNAVMESLSCGTPVVAFDIGGMPDLIVHRASGYLAIPLSNDDLAAGIIWMIEDADRRAMCGREAREHVRQNYGFTRVALAHMALYQEALTAAQCVSHVQAAGP